MNGAPPRVVIVGGGFGGLNAARELARSRAEVTLVDRRNHHLFQPLLYQVATAALNPSDIATPIRRILRSQKNVEVLLAEATGVDLSAKVVFLDEGSVPYDYLIVATGARHSYFGREGWAEFAPGLKSIGDALEIRRRVLLAFELAEREKDAAQREAWLTFVIVGAGPTGVELSGALCEIAQHALARDFRHINPAQARVILLEGSDRVLPVYVPALSEKARRQLVRLGVDVRTGQKVTAIDAEGVTVVRTLERSERADENLGVVRTLERSERADENLGVVRTLERSERADENLGVVRTLERSERADENLGVRSERIATRTVLWAAGVAGSGFGRALGVPLDRAGRVPVGPDLSIAGHPEVFVVGDLASLVQEGAPVPAVAPAAMQEARHAARNVLRAIRGEPTLPFRYKDKGSLATIGRSAAVADLGTIKLSGALAWLAWLMLHLLFLIGFRNRILVLFEWAWSFVSYDRGARLITGPLRRSTDASRAQRKSA